MFPSPHSGILFLWEKRDELLKELVVSVPSFGDSFFILMQQSAKKALLIKVSVPSFGDSFFIGIRRLVFQ